MKLGLDAYIYNPLTQSVHSDVSYFAICRVFYLHLSCHKMYIPVNYILYHNINIRTLKRQLIYDSPISIL